jgi:hypothetical protein
LKRTARQTVDDITAIENAGKLEIYKLGKTQVCSATPFRAGPMTGFLGTVVRFKPHKMASAGGQIEVGANYLYGK